MSDQPPRRSSNPPHNLPRGSDPDDVDSVERLIADLVPVVESILRRIEGDAEFTTNDFIQVMLADPVAAVAYNDALVRWGEGERYGKMVLHGQVIPGALRRSQLVEWNGYAYGEQDDYAVPAWWRLTRRDADDSEPQG